jgi:hypothetical protein
MAGLSDQEIKQLLASTPQLMPYVTEKGGVILLNSPFPISEANIAKNFIGLSPQIISGLLMENERLRAGLEKIANPETLPSLLSYEDARRIAQVTLKEVDELD